jgi:hypothetical protein
VRFSRPRSLLDDGSSVHLIGKGWLGRASPTHEGLPHRRQHEQGERRADQPDQDQPLPESGSPRALESEDALELAHVRLPEGEAFDRRRPWDLRKFQMLGLHRSSVERRDNGEAVLLQCAGDGRAVAAVGGRRIRRRTATSPVYDDLELFA